jgi:hypothetical protein
MFSPAAHGVHKMMPYLGCYCCVAVAVASILLSHAYGFETVLRQIPSLLALKTLARARVIQMVVTTHFPMQAYGLDKRQEQSSVGLLFWLLA